MGTREAYKLKVEAELELAQAKLAELKAYAKNAVADARIRYERQVDELERRLADTKSKLKELEDAGENAWERLKGGVDSAWDELSAAVRDSAAKFKN